MGRRTAIFGLVLALALPAAAVAGDDGDRTRLAALEDLRLSAEMARAGRRHGDPWLLASAARLRRSVATTPVSRPPEGADSAVPPDDEAATWIAEARRLGRYDRPLQAMLDEMERRIWRGRAGGPKISHAVVRPAASHSYAEAFRAGTAAAVYVEGDGDTDLTLRILARDGVTACERAGPGDVKVCTWTPDQSGEHTIQVINRGVVANSYALATN